MCCVFKSAIVSSNNINFKWGMKITVVIQSFGLVDQLDETPL